MKSNGMLKLLNECANESFNNFVIETTRYCKYIKQSDHMLKYLTSYESFVWNKNRWKVIIEEFENNYKDVPYKKPEPFPEWCDIREEK